MRTNGSQPPGADTATRPRHSLRRFFAGHVSRGTLLTRLLPLSLLMFLGTLLFGILLYPVPFRWEKHVLSCVISPQDNPTGYWRRQFVDRAQATFRIAREGHGE